jgi:HPt (histidine-containing phosphotransfer) domain-containing protein
VPVPVLDRGRLDHLYGGDEADQEFVRALIDLFLAETPKRLEDLRAAHDRGDFKAVSNILQTVQGAAANLGARSLEKQCQRLDDLVQSGRTGSWKPMLESLDEELARLALALDKHRQKAPFENTHRR